MSSLDRYLKATKDVVIKSGSENIEQKILKRISNVGENDKVLLDEKFLEYLKKSNSRLYLFAEEIKNKPARFVLILLASAALIGLTIFLFKTLMRSSAAKQGKLIR